MAELKASLAPEFELISHFASRKVCFSGLGELACLAALLPIEFCLKKGMFIGNYQFKYKLVHKITFQVEGREAKSIIDHIKYDREMCR